MRALAGTSVKLHEGELLRRERENRAYLMKLENQYLLRNFLLEAGRISGRGVDLKAMGGWEDPSCQLRGHFLGHWLSAAALTYQETGDVELYAKATTIVRELGICQEENGGKWVASIPEKYLYWIGQGKPIWAPQYTMHKLFMGLVDVYKYMKNEQALMIADKLADWFYEWSGRYSREEFDDILDVETGGMLEIWAELLEITKAEKYRILLDRYYRGRLFDALLEGKDALTNMHANTTIPEILGCARAYEVTGEKKWLEIVQAYWKCAVTDRGCFATGGQTQGEIWTPRQKLKARLGDKNQEHCTVYNMIRLAEFLFRQTTDPQYMQYIEYNAQNGLFAQTYWQGVSFYEGEKKGLLTYFLPMKAASRKEWAGENDSFFCCHGTMVQANAALNRFMYYQDGRTLYVTQYADTDASFEIDGHKVMLVQRRDHMNGSLQDSSVNTAKQTISDTTSAFENMPDFRKYVLTIQTEGEVAFTLKLRVPDYIREKASVYVNGDKLCETDKTGEFVELERTFKAGDRVELRVPLGLKFVPLPDDSDMGAFRYGPYVLAGITDKERVLSLYTDKPEEELSADTEREWGNFRIFFKTENQDPGISFKKISDIGYEPYQMYFKIRRKN